MYGREKELVLLNLHNDAFPKSNKQLAFIECSQIYWCARELFYLIEGFVCAEKTSDIKSVVHITQMWLLSFCLFLKEKIEYKDD